MQYGGPVSGSMAGFVGASITGIAVASFGRPAAVVLGVAGIVRTTYGSVFAKGREVIFREDTRIQVQLASDCGEFPSVEGSQSMIRSRW